MLIVSGSDALHVDRYGRRNRTLGKAYAGTFVGMVLDLDNPLPLSEIYDQVEHLYVEPDKDTATPTRNSGSVKPKQTETNVKFADQTMTGKQAVSDSPARTPREEVRKQVPVDTNTPTRKTELRHYGTELLTRDAGTAIRADLASFLATGANVVVSLDDMSDITPSLADEAFAKLAETIGFPSFEERVQIVGGTQLAQRLVGFVLKTRRNVGG